MLPSIGNKIQTEKESQSLNKRHRTLLLKQNRNKYSSVRQSIAPYIDEFKYKSITYLPQKVQTKIIKRHNYKTQALKRVNYTEPATIQVPQYQLFDQRGSEYYEVAQIQKQKVNKRYPSNKLNNILKLYDLKNQDIAHSNIKQRKINFTQRYDKTQSQYNNLPKDRVDWTTNTISNFVNSLNQINPFFRKLNQIVTICLLKIAKIRVFQENQIIQKQDQPMKRMGIVLWGQILLKSSHNNIKIYLFPGDSINQQILLNNTDKKTYQKLNNKKGEIAIKQSGKAKTKAAILYLSKKQYQTIFEQLVKIGQKSNILIVQNMMRWSYSKKKAIRTQFSRI